MDTILVINGETYWQDFLPEFKVEQKKIQSTEWLLKDNQLFAIDQGQTALDLNRKTPHSR